jgi:cysteine desulfurase
MSDKQERRYDKFKRGYQAKIDQPPGKPPQGGSNVKPPPNQYKEKK